MNNRLWKVGGIALLCVGISSACFGAITPTPEIDPASGANAIALLAGALMIIRGRRK